MRLLSVPFILTLFVLSSDAQVIPQETDFRVKLLSPIDTRTSKKDDKITAQVLEPAQFAKSMMEGKIRESKSGNKVKGKAVLTFVFDTLMHNGNPVPVSSAVKSLANSQGKTNVDEEGNVIRKANNIGKTAAAAGAGAIIGAVVGGGKGAAIGAGVGAAAALVFIQFGTDGPNVSFAPGSEFILSVKQR
jgi:hypothetical protein